MTRSVLLQSTFFTIASLVAFAANAVICRWALDHNLIDPISFTSLRLGSGAASLFLVMTWFQWQKSRATQTQPDSVVKPISRGSWRAAIMLFLYALTFSYGYVAISTATGALVLAAVVQLTMIGYALKNGDKLHTAEWIGVSLALIGLLYLVYPKLSTPSWWGLVMVVASAYAWALYTLNGKKSLNPLSDTAFNFYRTLPMIVMASLLSFLFTKDVFITEKGLLLAIISGGVTTGLGYILWYSALPKISSSLASASQLLVPLLAAFGAAWLINEPITLRLVIAATVMLGGLGLVLIGRNQHRKAALNKDPS
ncbi:DMT family transporter [Thiomicrorhabdus lithotrophica]|uniref:DMT family transporter n=1 Tax=Thiomicrorhabdus lithotrophica TaxID=2949997 RepID=A0ABY8C6M5_9GAMM|nr:DMT family transporter [Thiomicrorhabdus lithotrophica]WEJ61628.1 DMT family transporter [Thiomicrorhabdus lithotrophica]